MYEIESAMMRNMNRYKHLNELKMEDVMKKYDIRKIDIEILIYLSNCDGKNTARDIVAVDMFTKGHVSQSVKRMSEKGYITLEHDEEDLRVQHIFLTKKANAIMKELLQIRKEIDECVFKNISKDEIEFLKEIFSKMYSNISNYVGE